MTHPPTAKTISSWLLDSASPSSTAWAAGLKRLLALQADWELALDQTGAARLKSARVAQLEESRLTVCVASTASRAKLQFLEGELLSQMQTRGWQINAITYRVQGIDVTIANSAKAPGNSRSRSPDDDSANLRKKVGADIQPDSFKQAMAVLKSQARAMVETSAKTQAAQKARVAAKTIKNVKAAPNEIPPRIAAKRK